MTITTVIPVLNEEISIGSVVLRTRQYVDHVIVVDKGSIDRTVEVAQLAGAEVISHPHNKGKSAALNSGFKVAMKNGTKIIVIMNIDGQHGPDMIPEAIGSIKNEGYDMVVSSFRTNGKISYDKENPLFLNKKTSAAKTGFLAFSIKSSNAILNAIELIHFDDSPIRSILSLAGKNHLKVKHLNFEKIYILNKLNNHKIGVIVPAYNEEQLIEETINGIPGYVKRIYLIDDCSTDSTPDIIKRMIDPRIVSVRHEKNRGVGAAIITGYKLALEDDMDIMVVMAGDHQMDPGQLPNMLYPIVEGKADFTKGNRISRGYWMGMSKWRLLGNFLLTWLNKIASGYWNISDPQNGYVAISASSLRKFNLDSLHKRFTFENDMMMKAYMLGIRIMNVTTPARYGKEKSKIKYGKFIVSTSWFLLTSFLWRVSNNYLFKLHPIGVFYFIGFILIIFGIAAFFLWSIIPLFIGLMFFILGIILERKELKKLYLEDHENRDIY